MSLCSWSWSRTGKRSSRIHEASCLGSSPRETWCAGGPAQVPDPPGVGLKVAREAEDLLHRRVDADPREVPALDRVHGVTPLAAQVARVQAHEDRREADEGAFALDRHVAFAQEEFVPFA